MKKVILLVALALALTSSAPVIMNPGFEGGWHLETTYWTPEGGPYYNQFTEITPPEEWTAWWEEGFDCSGNPNYVTGRPEVRVIGDSDPVRVRSGEKATKWFTFWRCHKGGLYQIVAVEPERYYTAQVYGHSWFSNCSSRPHSPPYDYDCETPILWAQNWLRVGIDPTGGIDPRAPTVVWNIAQEVYGGYSDQPLTVDRVQAVSDTLTVFLESIASLPLKHCDVYWDDASLRDTTYVLYIPMVGR